MRSVIYGRFFCFSLGSGWCGVFVNFKNPSGSAWMFMRKLPFFPKKIIPIVLFYSPSVNYSSVKLHITLQVVLYVIV